MHVGGLLASVQVIRLVYIISVSRCRYTVQYYLCKAIVYFICSDLLNLTGGQLYLLNKVSNLIGLPP